MSARRNPTSSHSKFLELDKLGLGVLLYGLAVLLGACYLFAFWRTIGFNIFPYLSLSDYVSAPLNRMSVLIAVPVVLVVSLSAFAKARDEREKLITAAVVTLYSVSFAAEYNKSVQMFFKTDFYFENEVSTLTLALLLFMTGVWIAYRIRHSKEKALTLVVATVLLQSSVSMSAGYADGKAVFNGASQVHFLDNKEICEPGGVRDWVLLGTFGGQTMFMNTIEKRICMSDQKNIRLKSRKFSEGL